MKKAEIGELSCKILSIYAFVHALAALQFPVALLQPVVRNQGSTLLTIGSFVPTVLLLLFSALLWLSAKQLESPSEPDSVSSERASGITPEILQSMAFSVAGIFILVDTLPYLGQLVIQGLNRNPVRNPMFWLGLVESLIRLALGAWLLFASESLRKLKSRLLDNVVHKDW
jgi:hypothetical protein